MKKIILGILGVCLSILFSGCGGKQLTYFRGQDHPAEAPVEVLYIQVYGLASISRAHDAENNAYLMYQVASQYTLDDESKYFAIYKPEMLSNFSGSAIHTVAEFKKRCSTSALGSLGSMFDENGINTLACHLTLSGAPNKVFMEIALYDEKPTNILVYDAKKVIEELKKMGKYYDGKIKEVLLDKSKLRMYGRWRILDRNNKN